MKPSGYHAMAPAIQPAGSQTAPASAAAALVQKATAKTGTVGTFTSGPMSETCPKTVQMMGRAAIQAASESAATSSSIPGTMAATPSRVAVAASAWRIHGEKAMSPAVDATLSWKPTSTASPGCTAVMMMAAAPRAAMPPCGLPSQYPASTMAAMMAARTTVSSAPARKV